MRAALVVSVAVALTGCGTSGAAPGGHDVVRVVAAENFWGDITSQLGGDHVNVKSLIDDPDTDPHQYESDARAAAAVANADLVIVNGAGYDDVVEKLLANTSNRGRAEVSVADTLHANGHDVNPHFWYDLPRIPDVARAIETELVRAQPEHRAFFDAKLKTFVASLAPLQRIVTKIKTDYPRAPVAYTERVPEYLLEAAGLTVASPRGFAQAIEDGNEPSAGDTQSMEDLVSRHQVRVLMYNAQATSHATEHIRDRARHAGIPVVAVTETQPKDEPNYQAWQQHQLEVLLRALGTG